MAITAGQAWAEAPTYGKIHYTQGGTDGGRLSFSTTLDKTYNAQTDFNGSQVSSGNDWIQTYIVTGKTLADGKVYVRALPNFGYTVTDMTLIVEPSAPSSTAEAPRRGAPGVASTIPVTPVEGHSGVYTFPMPTDGTNVTVTASFPVSTPINVDYLDATGTKKTAQAYVLDGAELYLGESDQEFWYVCNSAIDYRTQLRLYGDTHIILADGCEMSVTNTGTIAINAGNSVLIYGQSQGTGKLSVEVTPSDNHYAPSGIYASNTITINGGIIDVKAHAATATATGQTSFAIYAGAEVFINGGQVTATGGDGIKGNNITLGWTNATDFIKASSYRVNTGTVKTAAGKRFAAFNMASEGDISANCIIGNATSTAATDLPNDVSPTDATAAKTIAGKTLWPIDGYMVQVEDAKNITASDYNRTFDMTENETTTHYYIYKSGDGVTLNVPDYGQSGVEVTSRAVGAEADAITERAVTIANNVAITNDPISMPGADVTIKGARYYHKSVKYVDADGQTAYTDDNTKVWQLDGNNGGTEPIDLAEDWYMVKDINTDETINDGIDAVYTAPISILHDNKRINIILGDGAEMTVGTAANPVGLTECGNSAFIATNDSTIIYGQGGKPAMGETPAIPEGKLYAYGTETGINFGKTAINGGQVYAYGNQQGIYIGNNVTINGGQINASSANGNGIQADCNLTINGGTVNATGKSGIYSDAGSIATINGGTINAMGNSIGIGIATDRGLFINGGKIIATAIGDDDDATEEYGIYGGNGNIILAMTGEDDYIKTNSYGGTMKTAEGKPFIAYTPATDNDPEKTAVLIQGNTTLNKTALAAMAGKVLRPAAKEADVIVSYIDANGLLQNTAEDYNYANKVVYVLQGGETTIGANNEETWYVVMDTNPDGVDAQYTNTLTINGNMHLILADGAEMNATPSNDFIYIIDGSIAIYAQSKGDDMGSLTCFSENANCIYAVSNAASASITINGGKLILTNVGCANGIKVVSNGIYDCAVTINDGIVTTTGGNHGDGIIANSTDGNASIVINGGQVTATGGNEGHGIIANSTDGNASIAINGGQLTATGGNEGHGIIVGSENGTANITLSLTDANDFITASSYSAKNQVIIPAGTLLFVDGTSTVLGNPDAPYFFKDALDLVEIADKTLRPSKNVPVAAGEQYDGIYQELGTWKNTDPNTKSYVPTGNVLQDGNGYAIEVEEVTGDAAGTIPNGTPIIVGNVNGLPSNINMIGTSQDEAKAIENGYAAAESAIEQEHQQEHTEPVITMLGTNTTEALSEQIARAVGTTPEVARADYMTLGFMGGRIRPLRVNMDLVPQGKIVLFTIPKLHVVHMIRGTYHGKKANSNAPTFGIPLDLGEEATGIVSMHNSQCIMHNDGWYTLDGRKLDGKPAAKGVYIYQGSKVVIK